MLKIKSCATENDHVANFNNGAKRSGCGLISTDYRSVNLSMASLLLSNLNSAIA
jgi:hypothetical protein